MVTDPTKSTDEQEPVEDEVEADQIDEVEADQIDEELTGLLEDIKDPLPRDGEPTKAVKTAVIKVDDIDLLNQTPAEEPAELEDDEVVAAVKSIIGNFSIVADGIVDNFKEDREEIEDTIIELRRIFNGTTKPQGFIVEGLVSALRTKAETNANAIKVLDTYAKLIAATKNLNITQNTALNVDLGELLSRSDDDE